MSSVFDVRNYGAVGDGRTLDTAAINRTVEACAAAGGGQVRLPPGRYLSGTVRLRSGVTLWLEAGARLIGSPNLEDYQSFDPQGQGERSPWHRALVLAVDVENVALGGQGIIDGNRVFDPDGEEKMRGPHTVLLGRCREAVIRDLDFVDSANYAMLFLESDHLQVRNVDVTGGWDGVHFRRSRDVKITGCRFFTGDDCIAGGYWEQVLIADCVLNSSCNGVRLFAPATDLILHDCLFYGPGLHPHRTSERHNMLAGLNLQPGAWMQTVGALDNLQISDLTMRNVSTPFHFVLKPGNSGGRITVDRVTATGIYLSAASVESWAETMFAEVTFRDITLEFEGGNMPEEVSGPVQPPGCDARPLPAWGFYAHGVERLALQDVRLSCRQEDLRPVMIAEKVDRLCLEDLRFPPVPQGTDPLVLNGVGKVEARDAG